MLTAEENGHIWLTAFALTQVFADLTNANLWITLAFVFLLSSAMAMALLLARARRR